MSQPIDSLLAQVLRGDPASWPGEWTDAATIEAVRRRMLYHGIAGLIAERAAALADWPAEIAAAARAQAIAQSMWELQHSPIVSRLLGDLASAGVKAVVLKGSALAYDLYPVPAARARGDTDLLIAPADRDRARVVLAAHGFQPPAAGVSDSDFALQEAWTLTPASGMGHEIDLHWQLHNAPALAGVMPVADCLDRPLPLPRLGDHAYAMHRPLTLLHSCTHRAMHRTSPYFVNGETHYGGDRLIWAVDIDLLARSLDEAGWNDLVATAFRDGVARVCLDGLEFAHRWLGTPIPADVHARLATVPNEVGSAYLLGSNQLRRARRDLAAVSGPARKIAYIAERTLPSRAFIRAKYPGLARYPVAVGYLRRMIDLLRPRAGAGRG